MKKSSVLLLPLLFLTTCDIQRPNNTVGVTTPVVNEMEVLETPWASGYYTGWMRNVCTPAEVDYSAVTHIMHFSIGPNSNGTLDAMTNGIWGTSEYNAVTDELIARTHAAGKKIIISIGGWDTEAGWVGATSNTNRATFIDRIITFVQDHGYDGVDVDWEILTNASAYRIFIPELHAALKAANPNYLLTAACLGEPVVADVSQYFDQINLMTYDMSGAWPDWVVWHNSPLDNAGLTFPNVPTKRLPSIKDWVVDAVTVGIPIEKIGIGTAFQGFIWSRKWEPLQDAKGSRVIGNVPYYELMQDYGLSNRKWDDTAKCPYLSYPNKPERFISYDDEESITEKINYIKAEGLGGLIIWDIAGGYERGQSQPDKLLQAVKAAIFGDIPPPPPPPPFPEPCVSFGNGSSNNALSNKDNFIYASQFMSTEDGTIDLIETYVTEGTGARITMAIYSNRGNSPGNLLSTSQEITSNVVGWNTTTLDAPIEIDTFGKYWICINTNGAHVKFGVNDSGGKTVGKEQSYDTSWPSSFGGVTYRNPQNWTVRAKTSTCE